MTTSDLRSLAADINEEANAPDHVLDERLGKLADELEQASVHGADARHLGLDRAGSEESAWLDPDGPREPGHEVCGGLEPSPLDAAHRLGSDPDRLGNLGLGQASFVSEGSKPNPDAHGISRSGHTGRVGRPERPQKGRSRHVMRLDVPCHERDHARPDEGSGQEETREMLTRGGSALGWLPVAFLLLATACSDKAQPSYAACILADTSGDMAGAVKACSEAAATDPNSTSGKAAISKLAELKAKADKMKAETAAKAVPAEAPAHPATATTSICDNLDDWSLDSLDRPFILDCDTALAAGHPGKRPCAGSLVYLINTAKFVVNNASFDLSKKKDGLAGLAESADQQVAFLKPTLASIRSQPTLPGEEPIKTGLIADYERVIGAYKRLGSLMRQFDGSTGPILKEEARDTDKAEHFDPGSDLGIMGHIKTNEGMRMSKCLGLKRQAGAGNPSVAADGEDGADGHRPSLPPEDSGFVDTHGGAGWGNKCFANIKAKKWGYAKAECDKAISMGPAAPMPMASILFNQGLIAQGMGETEKARAYFTSSLGLREQPAVRAALDSMPQQGGVQ